MTAGVTFKVRRDTAANWTAENPVLALGEPGVETDTHKLKHGDGSTAWASLPYNVGAVSWGGITGTLSAQTDLQAALDAKLDDSQLDTDGTLAANSDAKIASQKATKTYVDAIVAAQDAMVFKGVIDCSANPNYPAADRGHTYRVSVAGKIGGASGPNVEAGDILLCLTDGTASGDHATVGASWAIIQTNLDGAVIGPASATDGGFARFDGTTGKLIKNSAATVSLTADVSGTLPVANGGTGVTSSTGTGSTVLSDAPTFTGQSNFVSIAASSNITAGAGTTVRSVIINGGSGTAEGGFIQFKRAGTAKLAMGSASAVLGSADADTGVIYNYLGNLTFYAAATLCLTITNAAVNLASGKVLQVNATQVVTSRRTGWSADTGTDKRTANATYAGTAEVAYTQATVQALMDAVRDLSQTVKALKADLTTHGLIGT